MASLIIHSGLSIEQIVKTTAAYYHKPVVLLRQLKKKRNSNPTERRIAIYLWTSLKINHSHFRVSNLN